MLPPKRVEMTSLPPVPAPQQLPAPAQNTALASGGSETLHSTIPYATLSMITFSGKGQTGAHDASAEIGPVPSRGAAHGRDICHSVRTACT